MPTFETPEPILATVEIGVGHIQVNATDRQDTVVEVHPTDPSHGPDVDSAREVRVDYSNGHLTVTVPRRKLRSLIGRPGSVDVVVDLPTASRLHAKAVGSITTAGRLGESQVESGAGSVRLDQVGRVKVRTGAGEIWLGEVVGHADVGTASGRVRIEHAQGTLAASTANGSIDVGTADGDARLSTANGDISVDWAGSTVAARTAHGSVRIGEVERGAVRAESGFGELEIGIKPGVTAWIDARSKFGRVRSDLDPTAEPGEGDDKVEVRAHTGFGDVRIHRSNAVATG
jgi:DUF4097 and DUF4098 domain-containing protein YvlB